MSEKLSNLIKAGYPHLKEETGLAPWVLPEYGFGRMVDQAGDQGILRLAKPLGLADRGQPSDGIQNPLEISLETWQAAVRNWPPTSQIGPVVAAFQDISGPVTAHLQGNKGMIDPMAVCRSLAVLLVAPFVDPGREFLVEVAEVLGIEEADPAQLIMSYGDAVCRNDVDTLEKINQCLEKCSLLCEWSTILQTEVLKCRYMPKLIAVTPPPSNDIVNILAQMVKEVSDEPGRDNRGYPGQPVVAQ